MFIGFDRRPRHFRPESRRRGQQHEVDLAQGQDFLVGVEAAEAGLSVTLICAGMACFRLARVLSSLSWNTSANATSSTPGLELRQFLAASVPRVPQPISAMRIVSEPAANTAWVGNQVPAADSTAPVFRKFLRVMVFWVCMVFKYSQPGLASSALRAPGPELFSG
jgi:hypothetical protein